MGNSAWAILIFMMDLLSLDRMLEELHLQVGGSLISVVLCWHSVKCSKSPRTRFTEYTLQVVDKIHKTINKVA